MRPGTDCSCWIARRMSHTRIPSTVWPSSWKRRRIPIWRDTSSDQASGPRPRGATQANPRRVCSSVCFQPSSKPGWGSEFGSAANGSGNAVRRPATSAPQPPLSRTVRDIKSRSLKARPSRVSRNNRSGTWGWLS
ncbi:MAG: hypothetical protein ACK56F_22515, partial [bacterium]